MGCNPTCTCILYIYTNIVGLSSLANVSCRYVYGTGEAHLLCSACSAWYLLFTPDSCCNSYEMYITIGIKLHTIRPLTPTTWGKENIGSMLPHTSGDVYM